MSGYEPKGIERKWQRVWAEEKTWEVANPGQPGFDEDKPKSYVLEMLPYPSGEPHVGHLKCYAVGDAIAHFRRRKGFQVIHPMGYDAFGLPAENHAIRTGERPRISTERSIETFRDQFRSWGVSIDWSREIGTHEPDVYRWTQWIFLKLLERRLAYREEAPVQWCPYDQTVLANEQVIDGRCERCGTPVVSKRLEQWFFRITDYADRLLSGFDVLEPEHPDVERLAAGTEAEDAVRDYVNEAMRSSAEERGAEEGANSGVPLGRTVTNPVNGERISMFVADYVLMEYGTGAIMAVPAHDERDYEFAERFGLEIRRVVEPADGEAPEDEPFVGHTE